MTKLSFLFLAGIASSQLGASECGPPVLRDPGFDLWCGDVLCSWKLVRGEVRQVPTWHAHDAGVELVGPDSAISQLSYVDSSRGNCLRFSLVANVEENAEVYLAVDLQGDGTVEQRERIPTSHWQPLSFHVYIEPPYDGIRFELSKRGAGTAILAQIGAELSSGCEGLTRIEAGPRANGASCFATEHCASGICVPSQTGGGDGTLLGLVCAGCDPALGAAACGGGGEVCGLADPQASNLDTPIACVPAATRELAEPCVGAAECASSVCTDGLCSACAPGSCTGCAPAWGELTLFEETDPWGPHVCRPGEQTGAAGAPCGTDGDCASGSCAGSERRQCADRRACDSPMDCPDAGACTLVGIQGGTCA